MKLMVSSRRAAMGALATVLGAPRMLAAQPAPPAAIDYDQPLAQTVRYLSYPSQWRDKPINVGCRLQLPQGLSGPRPAVIVLHGSAGVSARGAYYGDALNRAGIATLEIDQWGARALDGGPQGRPKTVVETLPDVYGAIDLLAAMPQIDMRRIALLGSSWGGVVSLLTATRHHSSRFAKPRRPTIAAVAALYPVCWIYNTVSGYSFGELLPIPIRIIVGEQDDYDDGAGPCRDLVASLAPDERARTRAIAYPAAGHAFDGFAPSYAHVDAMAHRGRGGTVHVATDVGARLRARDDVVTFFRTALT